MELMGLFNIWYEPGRESWYIGQWLGTELGFKAEEGKYNFLEKSKYNFYLVAL